MPHVTPHAGITDTIEQHEPAVPPHLAHGSTRNTAPVAEESSESSNSSGHGDLSFLKPDPEPSLTSSQRGDGRLGPSVEPKAGDKVEITTHDGKVTTGTYQTAIGKNHILNVDGNR